MDRTVLTDSEWVTIWGFLSTHPGIYLGSPESTRQFLDAVLWVLRGGAAWRMLPERLGKWNSVFKRFSRWSELGIWKELFESVIQPPDLEEEVSVDSTIVRAHQCASGQPNTTPEEQALGYSKGGFSTKIHAATNKSGKPLAFTLTGGQEADINQAGILLNQAEEASRTGSIRAVIADKAYDADSFVAAIENAGAKPVIPPKKNRKQPREYDREVYKKRHLIENFFSKIKNYRRVFARYEKLKRNFLSFLHFVSTLIWLR